MAVPSHWERIGSWDLQPRRDTSHPRIDGCPLALGRWGHGDVGDVGDKTRIFPVKTVLPPHDHLRTGDKATFRASNAIISVESMKHFSETLIMALATNPHRFHNVDNTHRAMLFSQRCDDLVLLRVEFVNFSFPKKFQMTIHERDDELVIFKITASHL